MNISFSPEERELLLEILQERHRELLREISRATHNEFKVALKKNESILQSIIAKLQAAAAERLNSIPA